MIRILPCLPLLVFLLLHGPSDLAEAPASSPQEKNETREKVLPSRLPGGVAVEAKIIQQTEGGDYILEGDVTLKSGSSRFQADRIVFRQERFLEAEGNVLVVWGENRISGRRMTYDLKGDHGLIEDAMGELEPEFYFSAKKVEKIGEDKVHLESATVTTCTQPVPYWSFSVSSANIRLDHYARMWNLRLRARRVPLVYLPYMVWPVKRDRAAGLLFPNFGSTRNRGNVISQGLFIPLGRSADVTLFGEHYTVAGWGGGGEFNIIPNREGMATLTAFYIDDKVFGGGRYRATYRQTQEFRNGFRMVADINQVSDFAYFTDFERELRLASSPTILARLEFTRNGDWTSVNVRELRREQLFSDGTSLVQQTLPEIEWRGRSHRLGRTPLYLSYESSLASIQQRSSRIDADYTRADIFPTISAPISPIPWLNINPSVSFRATRYSQHQEVSSLAASSVVGGDAGLLRTVAGAGLEIVGPKLFRIFERPAAERSARYKNSFEPFAAYAYQQVYDRSNEIIVFDEVDRLTGGIDQVSYGFRTRLLAQRPRAKEEASGGSEETIVLPGGTLDKPEPPREKPPAADSTPSTGPPPPLEPIEVALIEVRQVRSFDRDLNTEDTNQNRVLEASEDLNADGILQRSRSSPLELTGRFNPSRQTNLDLRARYDSLFLKFTDLSLSGNLHGDMARAVFSLVRHTSVQVGTPDRTQVRLGSGLTLFGGKLRLDLDGSYDVEEHRVPDQRWRVEYYTQCCGFLAEYLARDFTGNIRRDFRFTIDLRGIGKLFDLHQGGSP